MKGGAFKFILRVAGLLTCFSALARHSNEHANSC